MRARTAIFGVIVATTGCGESSSGEPGATPSPDISHERYAIELDDVILDREIVFSTTEFPTQVTLGPNDLTIVDASVSRNENGFSGYLTLRLDGAEERDVGFWHPDGGMAPEYDVNNRCYDTVAERIVCGGILTQTTETWTEGADSDSEVYVERRIVLEELDYSFELGTWNFAALTWSEYREAVPPPGLEARH